MVDNVIMLLHLILVVTGLVSLLIISVVDNMASDPCSLSNPHQVTVSHWHLSLSPPNFNERILSGSVTINVTVISDTATQLVSLSCFS